MRDKKVCTIGKYKVILSERNAQDVYSLMDFIKNNFNDSENKGLFNLTSIAIAIANSIEQSKKDLSFWHLIKKIKYKKFTSSDYLLKNCSSKELNQLQSILFEELEGDKKKVVAENNLEEKSPEV